MKGYGVISGHLLNMKKVKILKKLVLNLMAYLL